MIFKKDNETSPQLNEMPHSGRLPDPRIITHFIDGFVIEESLYPFRTPAQVELRRSKGQRPSTSNRLENGDSTPKFRCANSGKKPGQRKTKPSSTYDNRKPPKQKRRMTISNKLYGQKASSSRRKSFNGDETITSSNVEKPLEFETSSEVGNISTNQKQTEVEMTVQPVAQKKSIAAEEPKQGVNPIESEEQIEAQATEKAEVEGPMEIYFEKSDLTNANLNHEDQPSSHIAASYKDSDFSESNEESDDGMGLDSDFSDASNQPSALANGGKCISKWSCEEVYQYLNTIPCLTRFANEFRLQDIDGRAMQLLGVQHLTKAMNFPFGPALKLLDLVKKLTK